jgi:hypothetical protein
LETLLARRPPTVHSTRFATLKANAKFPTCLPRNASATPTVQSAHFAPRPTFARIPQKVAERTKTVTRAKVATLRAFARGPRTDLVLPIQTASVIQPARATHAPSLRSAPPVLIAGKARSAMSKTLASSRRRVKWTETAPKARFATQTKPVSYPILLRAADRTQIARVRISASKGSVNHQRVAGPTQTVPEDRDVISPVGPSGKKHGVLVCPCP